MEDRQPGKSTTSPSSLTASAASPAVNSMVFALRPCRQLSGLIEQAKQTTRSIAGDQIYLNHPPHLTLYVASFDDPNVALNVCSEIVNEWQPPELELIGWHHFGGDVLTGNETLVCQLAASSQQRLRTYQSDLISSLGKYRNVDLSQARYRPHFEALSQARQLAVQALGFPFVGNDWMPHFTIASIEPSSFGAVWNALENDSPMGTFCCDRLSIFRLANDFPETWQDLEIRLDASGSTSTRPGRPPKIGSLGANGIHFKGRQ